ncbi:MAG: MMPL family transporter [Polyangiaceae bacterium]|nr:MMPL family transporter [Polyangiaceae bacterium]
MSETSPPPSAARGSFYYRLGEWVVRFRRSILLTSVIFTLVMGHQMATKLVINNSTDIYIQSHDGLLERLHELRETFGDERVLLLVAEGDVFSQDYLRQLKKLETSIRGFAFETTDKQSRSVFGRAPDSATTTEQHATSDSPDLVAPGKDDFAEFEDFEENGSADAWGQESGGSIFEDIISILNVRQTRFVDGALKVEGLLESWPTDAELPALKEKVLNDPTLVGQVISAAGQHSVMVIRTTELNEVDARRLTVAMLELMAEHERPGFRLHLAGFSTMLATLAQVLKKQQLTIAGLSGGGLILLLFLFFRHPYGVLGPMMVVGMSVCWTLGTMAVLGVPMTSENQIIACFLQVVGIGDTVHVQSVYRTLRRDGLENNEAICQALKSTGAPVVFTTLTTAAGLSSFISASTPPIRDSGTFGAFGVLLALALSLTVAPAVLAYNTKSLLGVKPIAEQARDRLDDLLDWCNRLSSGADGRSSRARAPWVVALGALLGVSCVYSASKIQVGQDVISWFPEELPIRKAFVAIDEHVGGAANLELLVRAEPGKTIKSRELLLGLEKLEAHALAYRDPLTGMKVVENVTSVVDVIRESSRAINGNQQSHYRVPDTQRGVTDLMTLFENSGPSELKRLMTVDASKSLMTLRVRWLDATAYGPLVEHMNAGITEHMDGLAEVHMTGSVTSNLTIARALLGDLVTSASIALCVITLFMVVLFRDLKLGLVSMLPNLLPAISVLGFMGAIGLRLDVSNLLVSSIVLGIAVDDTIHFLHQFKAHYAKHGHVDNAIAHAFDHAGRALLSTSAILLTGFVVFYIGTLQNIRVFGGLICLSIIVALVADLIFAPAILRVVFRNRVADESPVDSPAKPQLESTHVPA